MRCPKCQFDHALQTTECLKCGIVFSRYKAPVEQLALQTAAVPLSSVSAEAAGSTPFSTIEVEPEFVLDRRDAMRELTYRIFAVPVALLVARLVAGTGLRMAAAMLAMVLHESGHAVTAWLTGRWAVPLLWVTPHGQERSWGIVLFLTAAILVVGYFAWRLERWGWVIAAGVVLLLQMIALGAHAEPTIIFMGDGGAMVFATLLMAAFYAPRESAIRKGWGLRWGLLAVGALSFMHVFLLWTGPMEDLPFGEIEGVNMSDPSLLTEMYGWSVLKLVDSYVRLGEICLAALAALYLWGLVASYLEVRKSRTTHSELA
jgi:hypothetical protein